MARSRKEADFSSRRRDDDRDLFDSDRRGERIDRVEASRASRAPRQTRTAREIQDEISRQQLRRNLAGAFGLVLIALCAALAAALASWTVTDQSWNQLSGGPVRNVLGQSGATVADLVMQFFGLTSAIFFFPVVAWGWQLVLGREISLPRTRMGAWIGGTLCTSGFLGTLGIPSRWPLPTGLGGVVGDRMLHTPLYFLHGNLTGLWWWLAFVTYGAFAAVLMAYSTGLSVPGLGGRVTSQEQGEGSNRQSEGVSWWQALVGAWAHARMAADARRRRLEPAIAGGPLSRARRDDSASPRRGVPVAEPEDDFYEDYEPPRVRQRTPLHRVSADDRYMEPQAHRDARRDYIAEDDEPPFDLDDEPFVEPPPRRPTVNPAAGYGDRLVTRGPAAVAKGKASGAPVPNRPVRVEATARPQPGQRDARERQGRLLADDDFILPPVNLLSEAKPGQYPKVPKEQLQANAHDLEGVLDDFGVKGAIVNVRPGPVVTLYELEPAPGIKSSRVIGLADDIARSMSAIAARVAVIPGKNAIGVELPNARRETVYLRELITAVDFEKSKARLAICLGKTIGGEPVIVDLARMPHVLVAGTTGSGKSVSINTMILSLLYRLTPKDCRLIMIDPKMLELSVYDGIPHLLTPVVTDPKKAIVALKWTVREMEERYRKMSKLGVRNIDGFNARVAESAMKGEVITRTVQTGFDRHSGEPIYESEDMDLTPLPYIVVIIDEMADLMMVAGKEIEGAVQRLAQMARAAGIHVIMATQRPSVDVITGTIKANFPTRISFQVTSKIDSRTILGEQGAEQLLGQGDMLYMAGGGRIQRVHGPFVSDGEVEDIVAHLKSQGAPDYVESVTSDDEADGDGEDDPGAEEFTGEGAELYDQAVAIVLRDKRPTTSYIQRRLGVGYNKAASMIEQMEKEGLISPPKSGGKRDILVRSREISVEGDDY